MWPSSTSSNASGSGSRMSELGQAAGVATPVIDGLITLTSTMLQRDFRSEGRNLAQLGLAGKTVGEIRSIVETGTTG